MDLVDYLPESRIVVNLDGKDKYQVMEKLLDVLVEEKKVFDKERAWNDLVEREQYLSTGLENGLAVPHAKTDAVRELVVAFGLSKKGVEFDSLDGKPAHFIFLVLSPRETSGPHIKMLAQITRLFRNLEIGEKLLQANSPKEVREILQSSV